MDQCNNAKFKKAEEEKRKVLQYNKDMIETKEQKKER
jgi:hypothetical protein